ncbi:MAG: hypothetical protein Q8936_17645 [Bacillota bacterium]|nr:hypothetical protein [Bacillota bacterium]
MQISKIRFNGSEKRYNRFFVYTNYFSYLVRRPAEERPLKSVDIIMNCKTEDEIFKIGGMIASELPKISLDEYMERYGLN